MTSEDYPAVGPKVNTVVWAHPVPRSTQQRCPTAERSQSRHGVKRWLRRASGVGRSAVREVGCHTVTSLLDAYRALTTLLPVAEPFESIERAEAHRLYWRPESVRVVLIAESHVFTNVTDLERNVVRLPRPLPEIPVGFVRLVYCLGYGENEALDRPITTPPNSGTPQFWRIFSACAAADGKSAIPTLSRSMPPHVRLAAKLDLLMRLKELGVWLLDASPVALYTPGGLKPTPRTIRRCVEVGYERHVRRVLEEAAPATIICIGRGVGHILRDQLEATGASVEVLPQPNARLSASVHRDAFMAYGRIVSGAQLGRSGAIPADPDQSRDRLTTFRANDRH
jgi:hypothetical protein